MSRRAVRPLPTLLVTLCAAWLAGCSAPPQKERDQADSAIAAAKAADAAEYAPSELQAAVASLVEYDRAVSNGDYRAALSHALSARDAAYHASRVAGERKAAARAEADRLIVEFGGLLLVAKSRLTTSPPLSPAAQTRTRAALKNGQKHLQEARSRLDKQDYKGVVAFLTPMVLPLRKDLASPPGGRRGK